jgi:enterochelin esterase family protein
MNTLIHRNPEAAAAKAADEAIFGAACETADPPLPPEATPGPDVRRGTVTKRRHVGAGKGVYPGVARDYWVYTPADASGGEPAALLVVQDARLYSGEKFPLTAMLDSLIAAGDIPPTVAVLAEPGDLPGTPENSRGNRSLEYDALTDAFPRFLVDELLPEALAGLSVTSDPDRRIICGMSSGGICAFNVAWERPDSFARVISHCGSFTDIRGGNAYPSRVRNGRKRPLRVFLQSGSADLDRPWGNWPVANFDMATALAFRGYDYRFEFGLGAHDLRHGAATFPAVMRWIWR